MRMKMDKSMLTSTFRMTPELNKRIYLEEDGLIRGSFKINVQGDWTNDNDGQTACGPNDCDELNITLMAGPNIIGEHHETGLVEGDNTVVFNFQMEEDTVVDWNKKDFNPVVKVEMKLQGDYDSGNWPITPESGNPASFSMQMGMDSFLELPIDEASWDESFQDGGELGARNGRHTWIHTGRCIGCHCNGGLCQHRQGRRKRSVIQRIA